MKRYSIYFPNYWDTRSEFVTNDKIIEKNGMKCNICDEWSVDITSSSDQIYSYFVSKLEQYYYSP